jgi:hypothetical protein
MACSCRHAPGSAGRFGRHADVASVRTEKQVGRRGISDTTLV